MIKKLLQAIRKINNRKERKLYAYAYDVEIRIEHPQLIPPAIAKMRVRIDAQSKAHARVRLQNEIRITTGSVRLAGLMRKKIQPPPTL